MRYRFILLAILGLVFTAAIVASYLSQVQANPVHKPNQTLINRPNTFFTTNYKDVPADMDSNPQLKHLWSRREVTPDEIAAYRLNENQKLILTADVIKPLQANWLANHGMPTGVWQHMEFGLHYVCFAEPLNIKGNIIRYQAIGDRNGRLDGHELTLTVNNHDTIQETKEVFIEKVEIIYKKTNREYDHGLESDIRQEIFYERFGYDKSGRTFLQNRPDPNFEYHVLGHMSWADSLIRDTRPVVHLWRRPLSQNGYKWGDPFFLMVIISSPDPPRR